MSQLGEARADKPVAKKPMALVCALEIEEETIVGAIHALDAHHINMVTSVTNAAKLLSDDWTSKKIPVKIMTDLEDLVWEAVIVVGGIDMSQGPAIMDLRIVTT